MGTNFYFFRPLTEDEKHALRVVASMLHGDEWTPPIPLAVPQEVVEATEKSKVFQANRAARYDETRPAKHLGPWDYGKDYYRYWRTGEKYANHIGKRSAAGHYCWDCKQTLCVGGPNLIHTSKASWHKVCPTCGKAPTGENHALKVELGLVSPAKGTLGVGTCSSFSWALSSAAVLDWAAKNPDVVCVQDEYGKEYSAQEFCLLLIGCPIQYHDSVGVEFS